MNPIRQAARSSRNARPQAAATPSPDPAARGARIYLRASTREQDADRARDELLTLAQDAGLRIRSIHVENESGALLHRPELMRMIDAAEPGEVILVEQIDRLTRLDEDDFGRLTAMLKAKDLIVVARDLQITRELLHPGRLTPETAWMLRIISGALMEILAAVSRKDYLDRRRRQMAGIEKARAEGRILGRKRDPKVEARVLALIEQFPDNASKVIELAGVSRATFFRIKREKSLRKSEKN